MADNSGNFIIRQLQFFYYAGVHGHFTARHCPCIHFITADNIHLPVERHAGFVGTLSMRTQTCKHALNALSSWR